MDDSGNWINPKQLGIKLGLVGLLLSMGALYFMLDTHSFVAGAQAYSVEVVGYEKVDPDCGCPLKMEWNTRLRVANSLGDSVVVVDPQKFKQQPYELGYSMDLLYNPTRETPLREDETWSLWGLPVIGLIFAFLFLMVGGILNSFGSDDDVYIP